MMVLTDTHTHLYSREYSEDRDRMILRALERGVSRFFLPGIDSLHTEAVLAMEAKYPGQCFAMTGLHPREVKPESWKYEISHVRSWLARRRFVAVGEIGIDLYWDDSLLDLQKEVFDIQLKLAAEYDIAVSIHVRDAFDEVFEVLEENRSQKLRGIFHCFSGDLQQAERSLSYGMKLGISGVVTYKNSALPEILSHIDIKNIVLETDSPYLAPVPHRGGRNESAYLRDIALKVADIYGLSLEKVAEYTTRNSVEVFGV